jgi:hypothetical protein
VNAGTKWKHHFSIFVTHSSTPACQYNSVAVASRRAASHISYGLDPWTLVESWSWPRGEESNPGPGTTKARDTHQKLLVQFYPHSLAGPTSQPNVSSSPFRLGFQLPLLPSSLPNLQTSHLHGSTYSRTGGAKAIGAAAARRRRRRR